MTGHAWKFAGLLALSLCWQGPAWPQAAPPPDALAAAKELIVASKVADQINSVVPFVLQQGKIDILRRNPRLEREVDALLPVLMQAMHERMDELLNAAATIYARHFTTDEMQKIVAFYRSEAGQRLLQKQPEVLQETMALGQKFGQVIGQDLERKMIQELRNRGHNI